MNATMTINDFVRDNAITLTSEYADRNPHMSDWNNANHYKVTLKHEGRQMTLYFSQGYGTKDEPSAESVLECLIMDAHGVDNARDFEDWAYEYGYDTDSRSAEKTYNQTVRQTEKLKKLLGARYDEALEMEI